MIRVTATPNVQEFSMKKNLIAAAGILGNLIHTPGYRGQKKVA